MSTTFILILSILVSVSYAQTGSVPSIMCGYRGGDKYTFVIDDVPQRCETIFYGANYFNSPPLPVDDTAIQSLKKAGKIVYMYYMDTPNVNWTSIISDPQCFVEHIAPMITYVKNNHIDGIIVGAFYPYEEYILEYDKKISVLFSKIKENLPSTKIGLWISGNHADKFTNESLFDYSITNANVDLYVIDSVTAGYQCEGITTSLGGRLPVDASNPDIMTLGKLCAYTTSSTMDQNKIVINLADAVDRAQNEKWMSYSEYCSRTTNETLCGDTIEILYDRVIYVKDFFKGIAMTFIENDDSSETCQCGKYPVANTYIDAWENVPITCCPKIG